MLDLKRVLAAKPKDKPIEELAPLWTVWGEDVAQCCAAEAYVPRSEHPTPQFMRDAFQSLNGWWECAFQPFEYDPLCDTSELLGQLTAPETSLATWLKQGQTAETAHRILVPFSPEADISGVGRRLNPQEVLWYARSFEAPRLEGGQRCLLHFQAVDDTCAVWANGRLLGTHSGGYLPFTFDITDALLDGENRLTLAVTDPSEQGIQLRGKQKINRSDLWYTAQSGIWKPVWVEVVARDYLVDVKQTVTMSDDGLQARVLFEANVHGKGTLSVSVEEALFDEQHPMKGTVVASGTATGSERICIELNIERPRLWSPDDPFLYGVSYRFAAEDCASAVGADETLGVANATDAASGVSVDTVRSYLAVRSVAVRETPTGTRFLLNNKPLFLKGVLDQGYWPESHMTAPADEAFVFDIEQMKLLGFNMLRKHIKIEDERWYYHCDRLGMLVWQDMVTGGGAYEEMQTMYIPTLFSWSWGGYSDRRASLQKKVGADNPRYQSIWKETARQTFALLHNHPCVVTWVLFNEGWGQFNAVQATEEARQWDGTRPIESVSGWFDQGVGDYYGVHNYFRDMMVFPDKKGCRSANDPVGAALHAKRACVTCEFGGLVHNVAGHAQQTRSFGYDVYDNMPALKQAVSALIGKMDALEEQGLAGYVYTQVSDVEEETNGLLTYDRKINKLLDEGTE